MNGFDKHNWEAEVNRLERSGEWQKIDWMTTRMRTPHGWVVRVCAQNSQDGVQAMSSAYVPDKEGEWYIKGADV